MNWKEQLRKLEQLKEWDFGIELMQEVIDENQDELDAYLSMNYLLMNLLVEEKHNETKHDYYENLLKHYFDESYERFSTNAEYLFYTGRTAVMSEWFFGIDVVDYEEMLHKAMYLEPDNLLYKWTYYGSLDFRKPQNKSDLYNYTRIILEENSPIKKMLESKGSLKEYILELITNWSKHRQKELILQCTGKIN